MRIVKWVLILLVVTSLGGLIHYTLPRHDVVRIVGVETRLETLGFNSIFYSAAPTGTGESDTRDVRFIEALRPDRAERVYRNEDTGWGWPPYFKLNSSDMQARARDLVSTSDAPRWVRITYYGIRSNLLSTYPNVLRVREVAGPDVSTLPISRIVGFVLLGVLALWLYVRLRRLREETIEPFFEDVGERRDAARGRLRRWFDRLRGR
jgi:hypothetical protein